MDGVFDQPNILFAAVGVELVKDATHISYYSPM